MVSKETAQKKQAETKKKNDALTAKNKSHFDARKTSLSSNRGFNTSNSGGSSGNNKQTDSQGNYIDNRSIAEKNYDAIYQDAIKSGYISESESRGIDKARAGIGFKSIEHQRAVVQEYRVQQAKDSQSIERAGIVARDDKIKTQYKITQTLGQIAIAKRQYELVSTPQAIAASNAERDRLYNKASRSQKRRGIKYISPQQRASQNLSSLQSTLSGYQSAIPIYDSAIMKSQQNRESSKPKDYLSIIKRNAQQEPSNKGKIQSKYTVTTTGKDGTQKVTKFNSEKSADIFIAGFNTSPVNNNSKTEQSFIGPVKTDNKNNKPFVPIIAFSSLTDFIEKRQEQNTKSVKKDYDGESPFVDILSGKINEARTDLGLAKGQPLDLIIQSNLKSVNSLIDITKESVSEGVKVIDQESMKVKNVLGIGKGTEFDKAYNDFPKFISPIIDSSVKEIGKVVNVSAVAVNKSLIDGSKFVKQDIKTGLTIIDKGATHVNNSLIEIGNKVTPPIITFGKELSKAVDSTATAINKSLIDGSKFVKQDIKTGLTIIDKGATHVNNSLIEIGNKVTPPIITFGKELSKAVDSSAVAINNQINESMKSVSPRIEFLSKGIGKAADSTAIIANESIKQAVNQVFPKIELLSKDIGKATNDSVVAVNKSLIDGSKFVKQDIHTGLFLLDAGSKHISNSSNELFKQVNKESTRIKGMMGMGPDTVFDKAYQSNVKSMGLFASNVEKDISKLGKGSGIKLRQDPFSSKIKTDTTPYTSTDGLELVWTVGDEEFASKEDANRFINSEESKKPFTNKTFLSQFYEPLVRNLDNYSKDNTQRVEDMPKNLSAAYLEYGSTYTGILTNTFTNIGDFIDRKALPKLYNLVSSATKSSKIEAEKNPHNPISQLIAFTSKATKDTINELTLVDKHKDKLVPKQMVSIGTNPLDAGYDKALENIGLSTIPFIPSQFSKGFKEVFAKQSWQQSVGQAQLAAPILATEAILTATTGYGLIKPISLGAGKLTAKLTVKVLTPLKKNLVDAAIQSPKNTKNIKNTKPFGLTQEYKPVKRANEIDYTDNAKEFISIKSPLEKLSERLNINTISKKSELDLKQFDKLNKNIHPDKIFKDSSKPAKRANEIDYSDSATEFGLKPISDKARGVSRADVFDLRKVSRDILNQKRYEYGSKFERVKMNMGESIVTREKISKFKTTTVSLDKTNMIRFPKRNTTPPNYDLAAHEFTDFMKSISPFKGKFTMTTVKLPTSTGKKLKQSKSPNYITGASDFVDFQSSLVRKPQKYTNIVGEIKFTKGFIPNRDPTRIQRKFPKGEKEVEEDVFFKNKMPMKSLGGNKPSTIKKIKRKSDIDELLKDDTKLFGIDETKIGGQSIIGTPKQIAIAVKKQDKVNPLKKKLQRKSPLPTDWTKVTTDKDTPLPSGKSTSPVIMPITLIKKKKKKTEPKQVTRTSSNQEYVVETVSITERPQLTKTELRPLSTVKLIRDTVSKLDVRVTPKLIITPRQIITPKTSVFQKEKQKSQQIIKEKQITKEKHKDHSPEKFKATPISKQVVNQKEKLKTLQKQQKIPKRRRVLFLLPPSAKIIKRKEDKKRSGVDFLGNSKTSHLVGLFRRNTVIYGDEKTDRQILKDRKVNPNKQKGGLGFSSSNKKKPSLFSQSGNVKIGLGEKKQSKKGVKFF